MSSVRLLATQQARRHLSSRLVLTAIAVTALLAALSMALGIRLLAARQERYAVLLQQLVQEQTRPTPADDSHTDPGLRVLRSPNPGLTLVRGAENAIPAFWDFSPAGVQPTTTQTLRDFEDAGPTIDLEFVVRTLLSLLALVLSVEAIRAVGPRGELTGLRSLPIPAAELWLGQLAGAGIVMALAWCVVAIPVGITTLGMVPDSAQRNSILEALARLSGPVFLYLLGMLGLGGLLGTICRGTRRQYFAILVTWLSLCFLAPPALSSIAQVWRPVPTFVTMNAQRVEAYAAEIRAGEEAAGATLAQLRVSDATPAAAASDELHRDALEIVWSAHAIRARVMAREIEEAWAHEQHSHERTLRALEWCSPSSVFLRLAADLAGTGSQDRRAWNNAITRHSEALNAALFDNRSRITYRVPGPRRRLGFLTRHPDVALRALPQFRAEDVDAVASASDFGLWVALLLYGVAVPGLGLLCFVTTVGGGAPIRFRRQRRAQTRPGVS